MQNENRYTVVSELKPCAPNFLLKIFFNALGKFLKVHGSVWAQWCREPMSVILAGYVNSLVSHSNMKRTLEGQMQ